MSLFLHYEKKDHFQEFKKSLKISASNTVGVNTFLIFSATKNLQKKSLELYVAETHFEHRRVSIIELFVKIKTVENRKKLHHRFMAGFLKGLWIQPNKNFE